MQADAAALLPIGRAELEQICREYGITELAVLGSVARGEADESSDIDLLYTIGPGVQMGWDIEALNDRLTEICGRPVDLVSKKYLNKHLRDQVLAEAVVVYAA